MHNSRNVITLRPLVSLEERVRVARTVLQWTRETDPAFERRVTTLMELVRERDQSVSGDAPTLPPAA